MNYVYFPSVRRSNITVDVSPWDSQPSLFGAQYADVIYSDGRATPQVFTLRYRIRVVTRSSLGDVTRNMIRGLTGRPKTEAQRDIQVSIESMARDVECAREDYWPSAPDWLRQAVIREVEQFARSA